MIRIINENSIINKNNLDITYIEYASEHKKGLDNRGREVYYNYCWITHRDLGEFPVSYWYSYGQGGVSPDGYPWDWLMNESEYILTREQSRFIVDNHDELLDVIINELF